MTGEEVVAAAKEYANKKLPDTPSDGPELFDLIRKICVESFIDGYLHGKPWNAVQVMRVLNRAGVATSRRA